MPFRADVRRTLGWMSILPLTWAVCWLDGEQLASRWAHGQWAADALMVLYFLMLYGQASPRLRAIMKYGVVIGLVGETVCSLGLGMYAYRLHNIPLYVPLGHSVIYGTVYNFVREPFVVRQRRSCVLAMTALSVLYSLYWLLVAHDVFGAACGAIFLLLIALDAESRLFFLAMFVLVAFLEQVGTSLGAWTWYALAFGRFEALPSGNPPSGICIFYFAFDGLCLLAYLTRRPDLGSRYRRLRDTRQAPMLAARG